MKIYEDLKDRYEKWQRMELPGQPPAMHMGTCYLMNDLWHEIQRLRELLSKENAS